MMDLKQITCYDVDCWDVEQIIKKHFKIKEFSVEADMEFARDSRNLIHVKKKPELSKYEQERLVYLANRWHNDGKYVPNLDSYNTYLLLDLLATWEIIPEGNYLIASG